ncbi:hypothetical protein Ciccas_004202 [Cichlidogyrus casuarinus]|uniref:Uncharacterized protein n=1 Tax=Cichlidogyrus casuarinus TaxID=1844966 RepID=A0ABD2QC90_9PLAT
MQVCKTSNHLLLSQSFRTVGKTAFVHASPSELYFAGFALNTIYERRIKLINVSPSVTNMHILEPDSPFFRISYKKPSRLVPGYHIVVKVEFLPKDQYRVYEDRILVHTADRDQNLIIPLIAFPVINHVNVPSAINLADTRLGESAKKEITILSETPVEFSYQVKILQKSNQITLSPLEGIVSLEAPAKLLIMYEPQEYCTTQCIFEVLTSQFAFQPLKCLITAKSRPGHGAKIHLDKKESCVVRPLDRIRLAKLAMQVSSLMFQYDLRRLSTTI